jgi:hypothetical protein
MSTAAQHHADTFTSDTPHFLLTNTTAYFYCLKNQLMRPCIATLLLAFCSLCSVGVSARIIYVDAARPDNSGNGLSWANAKKELQSAIDMRLPFDTVWVKAGTYFPCADGTGNSAPADPRNKTFAFRDSMQVFGGFSGTETALSQRSLSTNISILSGDLGQPGIDSDNAYHVVTIPSVFLMNGFSITDGNSSGAAQDIGGGLFGNVSWTVLLQNLRVANNIGGSVGGGGFLGACRDLRISHCRFENNRASLGGGLYLSAVEAEVDSTEFVHNSAGVGAGLRLAYNCDVVLRHSVIRENAAEQLGGGIAMIGGPRLRLENSYLLGNTAPQGSGIYTEQYGVLSMENVVLYKNEAGPYEPALFAGDADTIYLRNSTFVYNGDGASQVFLNRARAVILHNNVFFGTNNGLAQDVKIEDYSLGWGTATSIFNNASNLLHSGLLVARYPTTVNITGSSADSVFLDASSPEGADGLLFTPDDGLQPAASSPLTDAGINIAPLVPYDLLGRLRIGMTDIGAFEYAAVGVSVPVISRSGRYSVYPNPGLGIFRLSGADRSSYTVVSADGRVVAQGRCCSSIDLRQQPSGLYFLHVHDEQTGTREVLKLIKQ